MSYLGSNDHIPYDGCPNPDPTWEEYRAECTAQINPELPEALRILLLNSTMPMSRWGRISDLMAAAYRYGMDWGMID